MPKNNHCTGCGGWLRKGDSGECAKCFMFAEMKAANSNEATRAQAARNIEAFVASRPVHQGLTPRAKLGNFLIGAFSAVVIVSILTFLGWLVHLK